LVLGPRIGKYGPDGKPRTIAGHHIPMATLGTFILLFGWFGFNAASTFAVTDVRFAVVAANTAIAGAFGAVSAMFFMMFRGEKPDPGMMCNGMLAGLVAITAPCAFVQPWAAMVIGIVAGIVVIIAARFIERRGVDDPVGAVAVHGVNGTFGVLAVGLFADGQYGAGWNGTTTTTEGVVGLFYDGSQGLGQLAVQAIAVVVLWTVIFGIAFAFFKIQNALMKGGIRPSAEEELEGMDLPEMGALAYPEFVHHEQLGTGAGGSAFSEAPAGDEEVPI
jgi:Amt family ammonium transporter